MDAGRLLPDRIHNPHRMMKRFLISVMLSASVFSASALPVSMDKARDFALGFMGSNSAEMVWEGPASTKAQSENAACYVFNNPSGGWVMVAGDDAAFPVLAYSLSGKFNPDRISPGLSYWMDGIGESIRRAQRDRKTATEETGRLWSEPRFTTKAGAGLFYETAEWGQGDPYNYYCPNVTERGKSFRSVTGCVATAMSIVMRQREWPARGDGILPSYTYVSDESRRMSIPERDISDHIYDWGSMPVKASEVKNAGTRQKQAIAQLMYDCGVMVQAEYNYGTGTGAFSSDVAPAMAAHLGYAVTATEYYRTSYDINDWISMLKKELETNGPILYYGATAANEGHAFVFSGYDSDNRFYVNWGWDGEDLSLIHI